LTQKNWSAAKWAILYPEKAKKNNLKQTHKARAKVSQEEQDNNSSDDCIACNDTG
jgi:hypothetical protein